MIAREDGILALSKSGETPEMSYILAYARRFSVPVVAVTCGASSTLAKAATASIIMPDAREACGETRAPTTSTTMMMAIGDAIAVALLRHNQDTLGASLALWLLHFSLLDVAPYVYDAYDPQIILLNGATGEEGGHDWIYMLRELNLLQNAHALGSAVYWLGVLTLTMAGVCHPGGPSQEARGACYTVGISRTLSD